MYYGHGSWVVLVIFGATMAMRAYSHRGGRRHNPAGRQSFTDAPGSPPAPVVDAPPPEPAGRPGGMGVTEFTGVDPGFLVDPTGRHQQRYWSGTRWTEHVSDDGVPGTDAPPSSGAVGPHPDRD